MDEAREAKLERLFEAAAALPPEECAAFLEEKCEGDPSLRAELESLLADAGKADGFLDRVAGPVVAHVAGVLTERLEAALAGRYQFERELGQGGMATVYLAEDLKHERQVAIKVLKPELAAVIGVERFLAEIKTTANLQNPHVLPLFDSGEADGFLFYVMPYIEGETLRERLDREKQLPVADAVRIATDVAEALKHAHGRGVIHRDIKPANILLQEGRALVADFGVALAVSAAGGDRLTETGTSFGTPHYMSPEQASADPDITGRSDLYSLGAVLHEMLTGDPPHTGPTSQTVLTRILTEDPHPVSEARRAVPPHVAGVVSKALEKLPADRFATGGELAAALRNPAFRWPSDTARPSGSRRPAFTGFALAAVMTLVAALGWLRPADRSEAETTRTVLPIPGDQQVSGPYPAFPFDLSRDGRQLVYRAESGGQARLFLRDLSSFDPPRELRGTEGAVHPFFSPDGQSVGFFTNEELRRVSTDGGEPQTLTPTPGPPHGASWGSDGKILYSIVSHGLYSVAETGGQAIPVPVNPINEPIPASGEASATLRWGWPRWPHFLPGARYALITDDGGSGVLELETGDFRYIVSEAQAQYLSTGHLLLHAGEGVLRLAPFELDRLDVTGDVAQTLERVFRSPGGGAANVRVSDNGTVVYMSGGFERSVVLVDRTGVPEALPFPARGYRFPDVSPDGRWIAVTVDPRPSEIWVLDVLRGGGQPVATGAPGFLYPRWHPSGDRLSFGALGRSYVLSWPNGGETRVLESRFPPRGWLAGGRLIGETDEGETGLDLVTLDPGTGASSDLLVTPDDESDASVSPDGAWIAFTSNRTGTPEVYVVPAAGGTSPIPVSIGGGVDGKWSDDGTEIFYRNGNAIMAVPVETTPTFSPGPPEQLFSEPYDFLQVSNWDPTPDGRFLMIRSDPRSRQFQVVLNWFEEIADR